MKRASAFTERESTGYRRTNPVSTMLVRRAELAITDAGCAVMQAAAASDQRTALGLGSLATVSSPLPVVNGGTASTTASDARSALGLGTIATLASPLPIANGGTASTSASLARTALGLGTAATQSSTAFAAASHDHVGTECLVDDADFAGTLAGQGIKDLQTLAAWLDSNLTPP